MIDEILSAYGARFVIAISGVFLALVVLVAVLWIIRNKAPSPFVRGGRSRQPRLQVLDATAVDTRRRLVLVRRDNIEHLILIGGPTDIVVESGIGEPKTYFADELATNDALPQQEKEARLAQPEQAALPKTPAPELRNDAPLPRPVRQPRNDVPTKSEPLELVMPTAPAEPERPARQEPPATHMQARAMRTPDVAPETGRGERLTPAPTAKPAPPPRAAATPAATAPTIEPPAPVKTPEPPEADLSDVVQAPKRAQVPPPVQAPPSIQVEQASLALDAARQRVLAPKVEPFAADRFKAPDESFDMTAPDITAPHQSSVRVDPDMESIKSEFEKILDTDDLTQPAPTVRPTVEPPVARTIPAMDVATRAKAPNVTNSSPNERKEGNLQSEIARIFGEMGEPRKD